MINADFVKETDKLIKQIKKRGVVLENSNVLVAKVKTDRKTAGGLFISDQTAEKEDYKSGHARVLALPRNMDHTSPDIKVGDYILHSHEARYLPAISAVREMLDYVVEEKLLYMVPENEIIMVLNGKN